MYNFHLIIYIKVIKELQFFTSKYLPSLFLSGSVMTVCIECRTRSELKGAEVGMLCPRCESGSNVKSATCEGQGNKREAYTQSEAIT